MRVLKPAAKAFVAVMPINALLRRTMALADERHFLSDSAWLEALLTRGVYTNDLPGRFDGVYAVRPERLRSEFERYGLTTERVVGLQSLGVGIEAALGAVAESDPETYERCLDLLEGAADDPGRVYADGARCDVSRRRDESNDRICPGSAT